MKFIPLILVIISSLKVCASEKNTYTTSEWFDPKERIIFSVVWDEQKSEWIIYTVYEAAPDKKHEIYRFMRSGSLTISSNQKYFALNHHWGSDGSTILIFQRENGLNYKLRERDDIYSLAEDLVSKKLNTKSNPIHHFYIDAVRWSKDNDYLLCEAQSHGDNIGLNRFLFLYDLNSRKISMDLTNFNLKSVTKHN
jgi:hypothetical protein